MARKIYTEPSRTLMEYRLLPRLTTPECTQDRVSLQTHLTANRGPARVLTLHCPVLSSAMQAVSGPDLAIALARAGGLATIFCSQATADQAAMVAAVKAAPGPAHAPEATVDASGRLAVAAAVNTHDYKERAPALVEAGADCLFLDSSDGYSFYQGDALDWLAERYPELPLVGGNIITGDGFDYLVSAGAHAIKVGMGGGSICITQEQKGTGRGLATSILAVAEARDAHFEHTGTYIPLVADGGLGSAKEITVALALGADAVMMGRFFAGVTESPNPVEEIDGRPRKAYWGEGSARAREWRERRYHQAVFVEGVEGYVDHSGALADVLAPTLAKIKASLSSCGCANIDELHREAELEVLSALSIREGQVHDIYRPVEVPRGDSGPERA